MVKKILDWAFKIKVFTYPREKDVCTQNCELILSNNRTNTNIQVIQRAVVSYGLHTEHFGKEQALLLWYHIYGKMLHVAHGG